MYVRVEGVNREESGRTRGCHNFLFSSPFRLLPLSWGSKRARYTARLYYHENILEIIAGRFDTCNQKHFIKLIQSHRVTYTWKRYKCSCKFFSFIFSNTLWRNTTLLLLLYEKYKTHKKISFNIKLLYISVKIT